MSDTPETDAMRKLTWKSSQPPVNPIPGEFAKKLERERDQALDLLKHAQSALDAIHLEIGGWIKTMSVTSK
jgi:hypothetical protein